MIGVLVNLFELMVSLKDLGFVKKFVGILL